MPGEPRKFDDLIDDLRDHPEWRNNLRELLAGVDDEEPSPPERSRFPRWLPTLGMGVLIGAIVAGVAGFALAYDDDGDDEQVLVAAAAPTPGFARGSSPGAPPPSASPATTGTPVPRETPATPASAAPVASESPEPSTPSPAVTAVATPTPSPAATAPAPQATVTAQSAAPAPPGGPPRFTFGGFEGTCAPVFAVLYIEQVTEPISVGGAWTRTGGNTVITIEPLVIEPVVAGSVVTVRFPTVAPLTPGRYTFTATADGAAVAVESTDINC